MDFNGKVIIITGASSGIGAATALSYAEHSARLILVGRNEEHLNNVGKQCELAKGIKPLIVKADLTIDDDIENIVSKTIKMFGQIDILVNNAGVGFRGNINDGVDLFDKAIALNTRPAYLLTSLVTPYLIKSKGNIVNVSSVAAFGPVKGVDFLPYCISKAALDMFTKCVALELGSKGVRVNSVNPGATRSPFLKASGFNKEEEFKIIESREDMFPLGKIVESSEVADMILYLSSDQARSITGSIFVIDNGELLV